MKVIFHKSTIYHKVYLAPGFDQCMPIILNEEVRCLKEVRSGDGFIGTVSLDLFITLFNGTYLQTDGKTFLA